MDVALLGVVSFVFIPRPEWRRQPGRWATIGQAAAFAALAYTSVAILSRPWHSRWGSTKAELAAALPGDSLVPNAHYTIQHATTIRVTPAEVWPWLVQLGQDRGGFYSYDWLERAIGDRITNADSTTRLIVRTRGNGKPNVALAPFGLLVFEPAHFIMQREMLRGIKARAEREARRASTSRVQGNESTVPIPAGLAGGDVAMHVDCNSNENGEPACRVT
jgi:hypothetical protein